jgi:hypothetical protein
MGFCVIGHRGSGVESDLSLVGEHNLENSDARD